MNVYAVYVVGKRVDTEEIVHAETSFAARKKRAETVDADVTDIVALRVTLESRNKEIGYFHNGAWHAVEPDVDAIIAEGERAIDQILDERERTGL